jgi:antitoxin VapB
MPFHVRDFETNTLVRKLATRTGLGITDSIKAAVANELRRLDEIKPLSERVKPLQDFVQARKIETTETDKAFWDDMSGNN